uniref:AP complex mu/sigma subunit domain-containing protein n=1 Tax=Nothobranchius furzeri TaxID=105023 RepID=A0A8C6LZT7_NOTFU
MIKFLLMVNQQGQTRLSRYFEPVELNRRAAQEAAVVRCCLSRNKDTRTLSCSEPNRPIGSSLLMVCLSELPQNELSIFELIQNFVEVLDRYFSRVVS